LRRNSPLKHFFEGKLAIKIYITGRRGRKYKQLLDENNEKRRYWKFIEEALDRIHTLWRTHFGRGCGSLPRQARE
jgi:hypothetical protein